MARISYIQISRITQMTAKNARGVGIPRFTGGVHPEARLMEALEDSGCVVDDWMLWCATIGNLLTRFLIKKYKYAHLVAPCSRQAWIPAPLGLALA